jgi:diguanylate cyclase (GGDEF)-like protein/PAS domain S-box-containing protein
VNTVELSDALLKEHLALIIKSSYNPILITNGKLDSPDNPKILYVNPAFEKMTGYNKKEIIGKTPRILQGEKTNRAALEELKAKLSRGDFFEGTTVNYKKDGTEYYVEWNISPVKNSKNETLYFVSIQKDISEKIELQEQEEIFKLSIEQSADHVAIISNKGFYRYVNTSYAIRTGYSKEELLGKNPKILKSGKHDKEFYHTLWTDLLNHKVVDTTFINKKKNGNLYFDDQTITPILADGKIVSYLVIGKDVSDYLEREDTLKALAFKDELTGLANRHSLSNYFDNIRHALADGEEYSIIIADIDHFKQINDEHGHLLGDKILKTFAKILKANIRESDKVFRWGGEEFIIIAKTKLANATILANNIREKIAKNLYCEQIQLTSSFGVCAIDSDNIDLILEKTDKALYKAKSSGRNRVTVCS